MIRFLKIKGNVFSKGLILVEDMCGNSTDSLLVLVQLRYRSHISCNFMNTLSFYASFKVFETLEHKARVPGCLH